MSDFKAEMHIIRRRRESLLVNHHHSTDAENARHENARNVIVWNTACCICMSIAEQECMSRQERAPDFTANCGCPICRSEITMVLHLY